MEFGRSFSLASSKALLAACVLGLLVSSGASMPASDVTTTTATISDLEKASGETVKTGMEVLEKYVVSLPFFINNNIIHVMQLCWLIFNHVYCAHRVPTSIAFLIRFKPTTSTKPCTASL